MTDTETRLRDYLQAQATTVPDTAQGPGFEPLARRRHWPVLAAAAAIAVVLAVSVTFLTRLSGDTPQPAEPVPTGPPTIPYTDGTTLHDGGQRVRMPKGLDAFLFGRLDGGGWLAMSTPRPRQFQAAVLNPDGTFRAIGPERSDGNTLSPDRKQVAVMHYLTGTRGEIVIVDIKTGKAVSRTPLSHQPTLLGWNRSGLWMANEGVTTNELMVWPQPGSGRPEHLDAPGFEGGLSAPADTDTIALTTRQGSDRCLKAGVLRDGALKILRQYCDAGPESVYSVMSPDGRNIVNSHAKLVVDVRSGKITKLQLPAADEMTDFPPPQFEDANRLILLSTPPRNQHKPPAMYRCDVRSGECAVIQQNATEVTLQEP
ncbi:hypothetical protein JOF29_007578 [Kribbella aluminosa]|uniref:WD40 repeat protein n=1 Tax=Kribbella aluminosa TaxID=416017 RepID=A0ABS4UXY8_9ACTN|nr:hypothetical protein [Kribbella aluminosa]MBP2356468.1 hypothetical protein [Kribbella aluminosa]